MPDINIFIDTHKYLIDNNIEPLTTRWIQETDKAYKYWQTLDRQQKRKVLTVLKKLDMLIS